MIYGLVPIILWLFAGLEWIAALRHTPRTPGTYAVLAALATCVGAWRILRVRSKVRDMRLGRDGERAVGQFLQGMQVEGLRVFHDVVAHGFNLDHVVICERGVYVVETKTWRKPRPDARITVRARQITKDGRPVDKDPVRQVEAGARWLSQLLEAGTGQRVRVQPVLVFPGWMVEPMDAETKKHVWILEPKALPAWIERECATLKPQEAAMAAYFLGRYVRSGT